MFTEVTCYYVNMHLYNNVRTFSICKSKLSTKPPTYMYHVNSLLKLEIINYLSSSFIAAMRRRVLWVSWFYMGLMPLISPTISDDQDKHIRYLSVK